MKTGLFFQKITFRTEFPGSNFLLPTFLADGKLDFPGANLLLATVNFLEKARIRYNCLLQSNVTNVKAPEILYAKTATSMHTLISCQSTAFKYDNLC